MTRPIRTHDIELAAARMAVTGEQPRVSMESGDRLATFELPSDDITMGILNKYATGELCLNIKRFVSCRNFLFKKLKEVTR
jgi:hypothetical protein